MSPEKLSLYRLGLKSFFEEGRSLAQISHASVVSVLNFFRENETVYMVMNYLEGATLQDFIVTARDLKKQKVFRESTIRSLFDEILRGLRIVHQHKMLHLDIKPANIFVTDDDRAVMIDFGAAREVLSKEGNFIRPMYTPGFAAPEMYRRDSSMGPWTDIYAIGACIYACMQGYPPNDAPQRIEKDRLGLSLSRLRGVYSDNLIEVVEWCMSLDPLSRPQSVFALQKELSREGERRYTKLTVGEKVRLSIDNIRSPEKKAPAQGCGAHHQAGMKFSVFQVSRKGGRLKNEDRMGYCYTRESGLFVLADGMGGHPEGEVAAQLALQTIAALYQREARPMLKDVKAFLTSAVMAAHQQIMRYAGNKGMLDTPRTTVVAAVLQGTTATWVHCGDSRLYVVRDGELLTRTRDHSHAERPRAGAGAGDRQPQPAADLPGLADHAAVRRLRAAAAAAGRPHHAVLRRPVGRDGRDADRAHPGQPAGVRCRARAGRDGAAPRRRPRRQRDHDRARVGDARRRAAASAAFRPTASATACSPPPSRPACPPTSEVDDLDEDAIERSIAEINEAIRRSAPRARAERLLPSFFSST